MTLRHHDFGVEHLTARLGDHVVLDDVTVTFPAGQLIAIVGGDGAGKSTLLRALACDLVGTLSLGAQRQVAFVVALAHEPEVLILDEPTSGVDALSRARLRDTIREQSHRGVAVLVTTHYMEEAQQCDRLLLMASGRLVAQGSVHDIVGATTVMLVCTGEWANAFAALVGARLPVIMSGRDIRVADTSAVEIERVLAASGLAATIESVPVTIEERMLVLARGR